MLPRPYRLSLSKTTPFQGKRFSFGFFDFVVNSNQAERPRFAVIISKKVAKKATARNRARRLIMKALENLCNKVDNSDLLIIVKKDLSQFSSQEVASFLKEALTKAKVLR